MRNRFDDNSKVVFKELANEKLLSESPGFVYDPHLFNTAINPRNHATSFSKQDRQMRLKPEKPTAPKPAPGHYMQVSLDKFRYQAPKGSFPQAARNINFTTMNQKEMLYGGQKFDNKVLE